MQHHYLLCDRRWIFWDTGPHAPRGNLDFRIYPPAKMGQPLMVADQPWEAMSNGWHTVLYDQGVYRCWYEAWDETYRMDCEGRLCYAESDDGITWRKPALGLVEFRGSRKNNIVIDGPTAFYGLGFHGSSVFIDPTAIPEERYKLIYLGMARSHFGKSWLGIVVQAYSSDGLHWHCHTHPCWGGPPTLLAHGSDTQTVAFWDPALRRYVGFFRSWEPNYGRCIARSDTNDFYNWPAPHTVLRCDHHDPIGVDMYNNAANRYESQDDSIYLVFMSLFNHARDTLNVQLATSRDSRVWSRHDRAPFIENGPSDFDQGGIYVAPQILPFRGGLAIPYHGVSYKHGDADPDKIHYQGALGMVTLPRDRFQGIYTEGEGEFCLQPFVLEKAQLNISLNAIVEDGGECRAALLCDGRVIPGRGFSDCFPVTGDQPAARLSWNSGADLRPWLGKVVAVRLLLRKAIVFAVTVYE